MGALGIGYEDGIRCYDAATGKIDWRILVPAKRDPAGTASADSDSDGCDEALFAIENTLYCVGTRGCGGAGSLLWQISMPAHVGPPAVADVDGSGKVSVLLVGGVNGQLLLWRSSMVRRTSAIALEVSGKRDMIAITHR